MSARVRVGGGDTDISDLRVIGNSIEVRALNVGIRNLRTLRADDSFAVF